MADTKEETPAEAAAPGAEGDVKPLDDEGGGKGLGKKKLLMIIIPILILGVVAALYFTGVIGPKKPGGKDGEYAVAEGSAEAGSEEGEEEAAEGEGGEHGKEGGAAKGKFLEVPDLLVNLNTGGGPQRFLKLKVKLEVAKASDLPKLEAIAPRVVDQFQTFLREMRVQDMRGSAGIYRLRQELLYRVNLAAQPIKVKDILFQEILIQ